MFSETSIIKEVNIINKVICYLLVIMGLFLIKDPMFIVLTNVILLLLTKNHKNIFIYNIVTTSFSVLTLLTGRGLWFDKVLLLILYTILLSKVTKLRDLRYVLELTMYKFKQKKITYKLFYGIYFLKNYKKHFNKMMLLKDDYSMKLDIKFIWFILKQSFLKAKEEEYSFEDVNKIRFYNYSKDRTYIEKNTWESWDTTYLICYIIILTIVIIYGR